MVSQCGSVVVIGGGTMGVGIAQSFLEVNRTVVIVESDQDRANDALQRIAKGIRSNLRREFNDDSQASLQYRLDSQLSRVSALVGFDYATDGLPPELVIETVFEDFDLKATVLRQAEESFSGFSILASNTSSLSVDALSSNLEFPEKFIGMHFFNPVPRSALIEIVTGRLSASSTLEAAKKWVSVLGKQSIVVRDSPGFATSRLGVALGLEAIRMVEEEVASVEDIDLGMVLGYRFPIGPLKLTDIVGLDVRLAIADHLEATLGPRFAAPQLLRDKVTRNELGRKTGRGFYEW